MKKKRGLATLLAAGMMTAMLSVPVTAATTYTPVAGSATECTFNKYLIMDAGDRVPNATFSFTIAPGQAVSADTSDNAVMQVLPGVGTPTIANVTFTPEDATATAAGSNIDVARKNVDRGGTAGDLVQLDAGEKYATKQATVDFSSVTFDEPGIYRYIITETANADHVAAGIIHDTDVDRVLDVYVIDNGSGTLLVASYVLHTSVSDPVINETMGPADVAKAGDAIGDKTDGFTNEYSSKDLKISKEVSGNQASRDKYFELTVKVTDGVNEADSFIVSLANDSDANTNDGNADATSGTNSATIAANAGKTNPTTVSGATLKSEAGQKFYLQHGQSVVIRGLAPNVKYTVTENAEDYQSSVMTGKTNSGTIGEVAVNGKLAEAGFTNTRAGIIPTGILMSAAPWILLGVVVVGGVIFFLVRSRKKYEEE